MKEKIDIKDSECFIDFQKKMIKAIDEKIPVYGDSWLDESEEWMILRLYQKHGEFELLKNPDKLISLANIAMLLYTKYKIHPETLRRKNEY